MKLYYSPGTCSLAVHIALREARAKFELVRVDFRSKKTEGGGDFREVNPRGYVPVLEMAGGVRRTEAAALLQIIAEMHPSSDLIPPVGTPQRADALQWLAFVSSELHGRYGLLWRRDTDVSFRNQCAAAIFQRLGELDRLLAGGSWLVPHRFTVADIYAFTVISWSRPLEMDLSAFPHLLAWIERVGQRPAVRDALVAEGLLPTQ